MLIIIKYLWNTERAKSQLCFHRAFIYIEKDQECWTAAANSKTEPILRRSSTALYEKNGLVSLL